MTFTLKRLAPGDEAVFADIAPDVFDEPIHPERWTDGLWNHLTRRVSNGALPLGTSNRRSPVSLAAVFGST